LKIPHWEFNEISLPRILWRMVEKATGWLQVAKIWYFYNYLFYLRRESREKKKQRTHEIRWQVSEPCIIQALIHGKTPCLTCLCISGLKFKGQVIVLRDIFKHVFQWRFLSAHRKTDRETQRERQKIWCNYFHRKKAPNLVSSTLKTGFSNWLEGRQFSSVEWTRCMYVCD
jgi:hypothetical protein